MRREEIVGQRFPVREMQHVEIAAGERAELGFERVRRVRVARDRDDEARRARARCPRARARARSRAARSRNGAA